MSSYYDFTVTDYTWHKENDLYIIDEDFYILIKDENKESIIFKIKKGFKTDGGSIPKLFNWFIKGWYNDNNKINACYILHDGLYGSELMTKKEADDILRSSLRDCGLDRKHASTVCFCVDKFAKKHYGIKNDKYNTKEYIELA